MKKLLLLTTIAFLGVLSVNAQMSFSHSFGGKYYSAMIAAKSIEVGGVTVEIEKQSSDAIGALYSPRLNLVEVGDNSTVSIGTHIGLAVQVSTQQGSSFIYDIPIVAEYNFGQASNNDNDSGFGFYIGGGYGIHNSSAFNDPISGPVVNGGLRFVIADKPLDLNVSYLIGSDDINVLGVGIQLCFGM